MRKRGTGVAKTEMEVRVSLKIVEYPMISWLIMLMIIFPMKITLWGYTGYTRKPMAWFIADWMPMPLGHKIMELYGALIFHAQHL